MAIKRQTKIMEREASRALGALPIEKVAAYTHAIRVVNNFYENVWKK